MSISLTFLFWSDDGYFFLSLISLAHRMTIPLFPTISLPLVTVSKTIPFHFWRKIKSGVKYMRKLFSCSIIHPQKRFVYLFKKLWINWLRWEWRWWRDERERRITDQKGKGFKFYEWVLGRTPVTLEALDAVIRLEFSDQFSGIKFCGWQGYVWWILNSWISYDHLFFMKLYEGCVQFDDKWW